MSRMLKSRTREQAELLMEWVVDVQSGDMVTILAPPPAKELVTALHGEIGERAAEPVTVMASLDTTVGPSGEHIAEFLTSHDGEFETPRHFQALFEESDVFIGIGGGTNTHILSHVPSKVQQRRSTTE